MELLVLVLFLLLTFRPTGAFGKGDCCELLTFCPAGLSFLFLPLYFLATIPKMLGSLNLNYLDQINPQTYFKLTHANLIILIYFIFMWRFMAGLTAGFSLINRI
jgi:hypothetical protein